MSLRFLRQEILEQLTEELQAELAEANDDTAVHASKRVKTDPVNAQSSGTPVKTKADPVAGASSETPVKTPGEKPSAQSP